MSSNPTRSNGMATPNSKKSVSFIVDPEDIWGRLPGPLHTIPPLEQLQYQIVPWDPSNPNHPSRYMPDLLLVKSYCTKDYYYWINCSKSDPQGVLRSLGITPKYPTSHASTQCPLSPTTPQSSPTEIQFTQAGSHLEKRGRDSPLSDGIDPSSKKRGSILPEQEGRNVRMNVAAGFNNKSDIAQHKDEEDVQVCIR